MKKTFIAPELEVIRIKNGDVIMNSHGAASCFGDLFCDDSHDSPGCGSYCGCDTAET